MRTELRERSAPLKRFAAHLRELVVVKEDCLELCWAIVQGCMRTELREWSALLKRVAAHLRELVVVKQDYLELCGFGTAGPPIARVCGYV